MTETASTRPRTMSRWQTSGIHLLVSAAIAMAAVLVMLKMWYPSPLFTAEGGNRILLILVAVDVVIGPLITLIIFKPGKPGLRFDVAVIGIVQAAALAYGVHVMFVARPVYVALVDDQFETVRANDLDEESLARAPRPEFRSVPLDGPRFVVVELPKDMKVLGELISQAQSGGELVQHLPQYYQPYSEHKREALEKSHPLKILQENGRAAARIDREVAGTGRKASELNFLPLQTRNGWGAVLLDAKTGDVAGILPPGVLFRAPTGDAVQSPRR